jgi:hypothetical protein
MSFPTDGMPAIGLLVVTDFTMNSDKSHQLFKSIDMMSKL